MMLKWILIIVIVYLLLLGYVFFFQKQFIYFPDSGDVTPEKWNLPQVELVKIKTQDNLLLNAWYHPPLNNKMPTILYFHGNAGHIGYRANQVKGFIKADFGLLLLSYRGYGGSEGKPSEKGLYQDARAAIHFLTDKGIHTRCIVIYGESLGTGVAVQMATEFPIGAVVLQSAYTSLADVAKRHYPFFPVNYILKDRFTSIEKIKKIKAPILFIHGDNDYIVPIKLGKKMYFEANEPKSIQIYPHAGHNDLPDTADVVIQFLKKYSVCNSD